MDVCLGKCPSHLAVFDKNAADKVMPQYNYQKWYIGGHSLGGAIAAFYAAESANPLVGIILLAPIRQTASGGIWRKSCLSDRRGRSDPMGKG